MNPFSVLGIAPGATDAEIKAAYKRKAFELHPDRNPAPDAIARFQEVVEAHDLLITGASFWKYPSGPWPPPVPPRKYPPQTWLRKSEFGAGPTPEMIKNSKSRLFESLMKDIKMKGHEKKR